MADYGYHRGEPLFGDGKTRVEKIREQMENLPVPNFEENPMGSTYTATKTTSHTNPPVVAAPPRQAMKVYIMWAVEDAGEAPLLVFAMDEDTYDSQSDLWEDAFTKALSTYGPSAVVTTVTTVNYPRLVSAFEALEI